MSGLSAPTWYQELWKGDALHVYQSKGHSLMHTITPPSKIDGKNMHFPIAGIVEAEDDVQRGDVAQPAQGDDTEVIITTKKSRVFTEVYEDDLDQMPVDQVKVESERSAMALGRRHDKNIVQAVQAATQFVGAVGTAFSLDLLMLAADTLQDNDVPWDGQVFVGLSSVQWNRAIGYKHFNNSDYNGPDLPFVRGGVAKSWNGMHVFQISNKTLGATLATGATGVMWHKSAVGFGITRNITGNVVWDNRKDCWTHNLRMRQAGKLLLPGGAVKILSKHDRADITLQS